MMTRDGFRMEFYKEFWSVIGEDVMKALGEFHSKDSLYRSLNATSIALIPQKRGTVESKDFHPISLLGRFYKLVC